MHFSGNVSFEALRDTMQTINRFNDIHETREGYLGSEDNESLFVTSHVLASGDTYTGRI